MFERRQTYSQNYGPIFRHAIGSFTITSSRRNISIDGQYDIETEEQLNVIIHEMRVAWQETLTLKRGKLPEKEISHAGNSSSVSLNPSSRSRGSR